MVVLIKIVVFWDVNMCTSKAVVTFCQGTWHHISEDRSLFLIHHHGNLKSHICCSHCLGLSYIFVVCVFLTCFNFTLSTSVSMFVSGCSCAKILYGFFCSIHAVCFIDFIFLLNPEVLLLGLGILFKCPEG